MSLFFRRHKCNQCDFTSFVTTALKRHVASVHERRKPYECNECRSLTNSYFFNFVSFLGGKHLIWKGSLSLTLTSRLIFFVIFGVWLMIDSQQLRRVDCFYQILKMTRTEYHLSKLNPRRSNILDWSGQILDVTLVFCLKIQTEKQRHVALLRSRKHYKSFEKASKRKVCLV